MFCLLIDSAVAERLTSLRSDTDSTQAPALAQYELQIFTRTQDALDSYESDIPEVQKIDQFNQVKNQYDGPSDFVSEFAIQERLMDDHHAFSDIDHQVSIEAR
jgi:hypothetical protein